MPRKMALRSGGSANWMKMATTRSNAASGHSKTARSASTVSIFTCAPGGQAAGFRKTHRGGVDGDDLQALLGEPHAVPAFAVGDREGPLVPAHEVGLRRKESVRLFAEDIRLGLVALVPEARHGLAAWGAQ